MTKNEREAKIRNMSVKKYLQELEAVRAADERLRDIELDILNLSEEQGIERKQRLANQRNVLKFYSPAWFQAFLEAGWTDPTKVLL